MAARQGEAADEPGSPSENVSCRVEPGTSGNAVKMVRVEPGATSVRVQRVGRVAVQADRGVVQLEVAVEVARVPAADGAVEGGLVAEGGVRGGGSGGGGGGGGGGRHAVRVAPR